MPPIQFTQRAMIPLPGRAIGKEKGLPPPSNVRKGRMSCAEFMRKLVVVISSKAVTEGFRPWEKG